MITCLLIVSMVWLSEVSLQSVWVSLLVHAWWVLIRNWSWYVTILVGGSLHSHSWWSNSGQVAWGSLLLLFPFISCNLLKSMHSQYSCPLTNWTLSFAWALAKKLTYFKKLLHAGLAIFGKEPANILNEPAIMPANIRAEASAAAELTGWGCVVSKI